jgi:hypothetical protein
MTTGKAVQQPKVEVGFEGRTSAVPEPDIDAEIKALKSAASSP